MIVVTIMFIILTIVIVAVVVIIIIIYNNNNNNIRNNIGPSFGSSIWVLPALERSFIQPRTFFTTALLSTSWKSPWCVEVSSRHMRNVLVRL